MRFDKPHHDIDAPLRERVRFLQHAVGLADACSETDVDLKPPAPRAFDELEEVRRPSALHVGSLPRAGRRASGTRARQGAPHAALTRVAERGSSTRIRGPKARSSSHRRNLPEYPLRRRADVGAPSMHHHPLRGYGTGAKPSRSHGSRPGARVRAWRSLLARLARGGAPERGAVRPGEPWSGGRERSPSYPSIFPSGRAARRWTQGRGLG